jgi:hypothetical protein
MKQAARAEDEIQKLATAKSARHRLSQTLGIGAVPPLPATGSTVSDTDDCKEVKDALQTQARKRRKQLDLTPNDKTYEYVIVALSRGGQRDLALNIYEEMRRPANGPPVKLTKAAYTAFVDLTGSQPFDESSAEMPAKNLNCEGAEARFDYGSCIESAAQSNDWEQCLYLLRDMQSVTIVGAGTIKANGKYEKASAERERLAAAAAPNQTPRPVYQHETHKQFEISWSCESRVWAWSITEQLTEPTQRGGRSILYQLKPPESWPESRPRIPLSGTWKQCGKGIVPCPSHMVRDLEPTVFSYMAVHRACTHAGKRHESFDMLERMALARKTDPARRKELADHAATFDHNMFNNDMPSQTKINLTAQKCSEDVKLNVEAWYLVFFDAQQNELARVVCPREQPKLVNAKGELMLSYQKEMEQTLELFAAEAEAAKTSECFTKFMASFAKKQADLEDLAKACSRTLYKDAAQTMAVKLAVVAKDQVYEFGVVEGDKDVLRISAASLLKVTNDQKKVILKHKKTDTLTLKLTTASSEDGDKVCAALQAFMSKCKDGEAEEIEALTTSDGFKIPILDAEKKPVTFRFNKIAPMRSTEPGVGPPR